MNIAIYGQMFLCPAGVGSNPDPKVTERLWKSHVSVTCPVDVNGVPSASVAGGTQW